ILLAVVLGLKSIAAYPNPSILRGASPKALIPLLPLHERLETPALRLRPPKGLGRPYSST
ncbi:hypothetical protein L249_5979, partial [Ophiocordyceps polyrhachis-furcata BCC 54312]